MTGVHTCALPILCKKMVATEKELSDDEVQGLMKDRRDARELGKFAEADSIRETLLWQGIIVEDNDPSLDSQWRRLPVSMSLRGRGCLCWMRRKEEFCGLPIPGSQEYFCADHLEQHKGRVPCPLDPRHSITIAKLAGHLRVCQSVTLQPTAAPAADDPFLKQGVNVGDAQEVHSSAKLAARVPIPVGASDDELPQLAGLARRLLCALWRLGALVAIEDSSLPSDNFDLSTIQAVAEAPSGEDFVAPWGAGHLRLRAHPYEEILPESCQKLVSAAPAANNRKARNGHHDVIQQASIAGHLDRIGWIPLRAQDAEDCGCKAQKRYAEPLSLVEFGAGSAHLSDLISQVSREPIAHHVLIDRQAVRRSADKRMRVASASDSNRQQDRSVGVTPEAVVQRVQCDISDLDLAAMLTPSLRPTPEAAEEAAPASVVAIGKHICGAATDLSLRCCLRTAKSSSTRFRGIAFALCCHHVCDWSCYVGQEWLTENGLGEEDFNSMRWFAKLAHSQDRQRQQQASAAGGRAGRLASGKSAGARAAAARAELGQLSKRLLDEGRRLRLVAEGWSCRLVRFVKREASPENVLLLAWPGDKRMEFSQPSVQSSTSGAAVASAESPDGGSDKHNVSSDGRLQSQE